MVTRQFKEEEYEAVKEHILSTARRNSLAGIYEVDMTVDGERYTVYIQPDSRRKMNVLYALRVCGEGTKAISEGAVLAALIELIGYQTINRL